MLYVLVCVFEHSPLEKTDVQLVSVVTGSHPAVLDWKVWVVLPFAHAVQVAVPLRAVTWERIPVTLSITTSPNCPMLINTTT